MQRIISLFIVMLSSVGSMVYSQAKQSATDSALIFFSVADQKGQAFESEIGFYSPTTQKTVYCSSQIGNVILPINDTYVVYSKLSSDSYELPLSDKSYLNYRLAFQFDTSAQLHPSPTETLVTLLLMDRDGQPQIENVKAVNEKTGQSFSGITDEQGLLKFLLPNGVEYSLTVGNTPNYSRLNVPELAFNLLEKHLQYEGTMLGALQPCQDSALFNLRYMDLKEKPVVNETFTVRNVRTGMAYTSTPSNKKGMAQVKVPIGDEYSISAQYFRDFAKQEIPAVPNLYFVKQEFKFMRSSEWEKEVAAIKHETQKQKKLWFKLEQELKEFPAHCKRIRRKRAKRLAREDELKRKKEELHRVTET